MTTSVGQLLLKSAVPKDLQKDRLNFDKKSTHEFFTTLANNHPEQYKDVLKRLSEIASEAAWNAGASISLSGLRKSKAKETVLAPVRAKVQAIIDDDSLSDEERNKAIVETLLPTAQPLIDAVLEEAKQENSPYYRQVASGGRGKASDLNSLRGADLLATDNKERPIPFPVFHSYAEGLDPAEWFAGSFSQRRNMSNVKLGTASAGYSSKMLVNAAHRLVVNKEKPIETRLPVGLPTTVDDRDNVGAVLAYDAGPYKAGTTLTSGILDDLDDKDIKDILVHSPLTDLSEDGGISRYAAGKRDRDQLALIGDNIGVTSAQVIGEKLSQGMLSSKHASMMGNKRQNRSGQVYLDRLLSGPENFPEAGPLADISGKITNIVKAPQGGHDVFVGDKSYHIGEGLEPVVKIGDEVDIGDDLSDGVPHPKQLVALRGLGEARRVYMNYLKEGLADSGVAVTRRNIEPVVAGLLNWAKVDTPDGIGDAVPDDIVPANKLIAQYKPRPTAKPYAPSLAIGKYLEEPALHYTPGTLITKKVAADLQKWKIKDVTADDNTPEWSPYMERAVMGVYHDPDWQTRLQGFYTSGAFLDSLHRGGVSDTKSTSYVSALAKGVDFGKDLRTKGIYG
jgi:DNA-directed RNA polymerase subunit beta'